jgi:prophage regulatory protein
MLKKKPAPISTSQQQQNPAPVSTSKKVLRLSDVVIKTVSSRSRIYAMLKEGTFPPPFPLGERAVGWLESEIDAWIESRVALRG